MCAFQLLYTEILSDHFENIDNIFPVLWCSLRPQFDNELFSVISLLLLACPCSKNMLLAILTSPPSHSRYVSLAKSILSNSKKAISSDLESLMADFSISKASIVKDFQSTNHSNFENLNDYECTVDAFKASVADRIKMGEKKTCHLVN